MPVFTPHQDAALKAGQDVTVSKLKAKPGERGTPQVFRLFGYAGTGKTTLARHLAEHVDGKVAFAAFTGKAALVMRRKGCASASTIHSLIYRTRDSGEETPSFELWDDAPAAKAKLIVIDECSMVDAELGRDLLSFGAPVLVLGDPAQLPPIQGGGFFTDAEPDAMLTEVHRQAADDPIIHLSMAVRAGERIEPGRYGDSEVVRKSALDPERVLGADQVLVGRNATRRAFNGGLWTVKQRSAARASALGLRLAPDEDIGRAVKVTVRRECFTGGLEDLDWQQRKRYDEFDYGYVLTVHKAQGSQWDDVVLFDESFAFADTRARWLYTGITRAARRLTIVV